MANDAERLKNYRTFNSLLKNINKLKEYGEICNCHADYLVERTKSLYSKLKADFRQKNKRDHKPRGRPRIPIRSEAFKTCKRPGCGKPPAPNQAYCCREHAPFSHYLTCPDR